MYKLLRRISSSFTGRLDRTWDDDATSNAPQTGSKRRMSDEHEEPTGSLSKRSRAHGSTQTDENESETATPKRDDSPASTVSPALPRKETEEVRQVTKGVKEVELEDKKGKGKEVIKEAPGDEVKVESIAEKSENTPSVEESKPDEAPEVEEVTDTEPIASDAKGDKTSEPSKDDTPTDASVSADAPEVPSESKPTPEEPAAAVADAKEASDSTLVAPLADKQAADFEPAPVSESPVSRASDESLARVQEEE